jgi:hypothetical protein
MYPGENSLAQLRERGWPVWTAALVSRIEGITTQRAEDIVRSGGLVVDGSELRSDIEYLREGALVEIQGRKYQVGAPGPDTYGTRP